MNPDDLLGLLRSRIDEQADIHDMTDNGGWGLVRWSRPNPLIPGGTEHVVHRWAVRDTAGRDIPARFYSGSYHPTEDGARADYRGRVDSPPR